MNPDLLPPVEAPPEVHAAAQTLSSYFEGLGMQEWRFMGVADRRLVERMETPTTDSTWDACAQLDGIEAMRLMRDQMKALEYERNFYSAELNRIRLESRFRKFGSLVWDYIRRLGGRFCDEEISEDILPLAREAGLCDRVEYDPEIHGEGIEADPGSEIWYWG